jgi:hypothetical protein
LQSVNHIPDLVKLLVLFQKLQTDKLRLRSLAYHNINTVNSVVFSALYRTTSICGRLLRYCAITHSTILFFEHRTAVPVTKQTHNMGAVALADIGLPGKDGAKKNRQSPGFKRLSWVVSDGIKRLFGVLDRNRTCN